MFKISADILLLS